MNEMTTDPICRGLLADAVENPGESAGIALILADRLDDLGDHDQAAFHRLPLADAGFRNARTRGRHKAHRSQVDRVRATIPDLFPKTYFVGLWPWGDFRKFRLTASYGGKSFSTDPKNVCLVVRHGFLTEIACSFKVWLKAGPSLVRRHPVVDVAIPNLDPDYGRYPEEAPGYEHMDRARFWKSRGDDGFFYRGSQFVPASIFDRLTGGFLYREPKAAMRFYRGQGSREAYADLSLACVNWARSEAGFPPLACTPPLVKT